MVDRTYVMAGAVTVALTAASLVAVAAADPESPGRGGWMSGTYGPGAGSSCAVPSLPGQRVTVVLADTGGRRMHGGMRRGPAGAAMVLRAEPTTVEAGPVSLVALNHGVRTHELLVLPLPSGWTAGGREVGEDGTVAESDSLGEAAADCAAGEGDGISAGSAGWVTVTLEPGRYELLCNEPGHYAAGMYSLLEVT